MTQEEREQQLGEVFTPTAPINRRELLAGRTEQIIRILDAFAENGKHVVLYGDRGVGKTSLANVLHEDLRLKTWRRESVTAQDTFGAIWRRFFRQISLDMTQQLTGFRSRSESSTRHLSDYITCDDADVDANMIADLIFALGGRWLFVIDEYDRLESAEVKKRFSDLIKQLSDRGCQSSLLIVGVGDDIDSLLVDHPSVERNISQIRLHELSKQEARALFSDRLERLEMKASEEVTEMVGILSSGYPHYVHLLGKFAVERALARGAAEVTHDDLIQSLQRCVDDAQHSIRTTYTNAVSSPHADARYKQTLLACALAPTDDLGYFKASDMVAAYSAIEGRSVPITSFNRHLGEFSKDARGKVLSVDGKLRRQRYRFKNPLLKPYVLMRGLSDKLISDADFRQAFTPHSLA